MKKSKQKNLLQLLFLLLGLGIVFIVYSFIVLPSAQKKQNSGKIKLLGNFYPSDVIGMRIVYKDSNNRIYDSLLTNINGRWNILSPIAMKADDGKIEAFLHDLSKIKTEKIIPRPSLEQIKSYGFQNPHDRFIFYLKDGRTCSIINGDIAATEKYYYTLKNNNTNRVLITYAYKFSSAERSTDELADSRVFSIPVNKIKHFEIRSFDNTLYDATLFVSNSQHYWHFISPYRFIAKDYPVKKMLMKLYTLRFDSFASYLKTNKIIHAFQQRVLLQDNSQKQSLSISSINKTNEIRGVASQLPGVLIFSPDSISNVLSFKKSDFHHNEQQ